MKKIRLGVIGVGMAWERLHYPAISEMPDKYEVCRLYDLDTSKPEKFVETHNLSGELCAKTQHEILKDENIDAVVVAVPIEANFEVAKAVIEAGKPLVAEKPFASSIEGAEELVRIAKEKNVIVMVAENFRFNEESGVMKNWIKNNDIGDIVYFVETNVCNFEQDMKKDTFAAKEWRQHPKYYGGTFLDSAIHDLARLRYLFGNVKSVSAYGKRQNEDFNKFSSIGALLVFESGVSGYYNYFCQGEETIKPPVGLRVFGTNGEFALYDKTRGSLMFCKSNEEVQCIPFTPQRGYFNEFVNFYNVLNGTESNSCPPDLELGDIKLVMGILDSIDKNIVVNF